MHSTPEQKTEDQEKMAQYSSANTNAGVVDNNFSSSSVDQTSPSSRGDCWKSEHLHDDFHVEDCKEFHQFTLMKKSQSLGNILDKERGFSGGDITDDDDDGINPRFSFKYSNEKGMERTDHSLGRNPYPEVDKENLGINFCNEHKGNDPGEPFGMTFGCVHRDSLFSIEVVKQFDGNHQGAVDEPLTDLVDDSRYLSLDDPPVYERSCSVINLRGDTDNSTECDTIHEMRARSKSCGHLDSISGGTSGSHEGYEVIPPEITQIRLGSASNSYYLPYEPDGDRKGLPDQVDSGEEHPFSEISSRFIEGQEDEGKYWGERYDCVNQSTIARYQSHDDVTSENERKSEIDDEKTKNLQLESDIQKQDELNPKEFHIRRIEEWINQIDIGSGSIVEEPGESSYSFSNQDRHAEVSTPFIKPDAKSSLGMEAAYKYVSSLTATSSSAQMVKLGLVAIPSFSKFASLRVLNLSGNSIVRITPGSLPRGLHLLNLSKNNIAVIECLRDLTHLRILDLSYNRIVRIGHGLASCSSLKELYLAGNKISEIEGLHRLLKLNVLDLRGNKISTAKGLGQLAANYGSMQAINLDGNPAQRNVGDEYLKKYLLSLLPNLVYYNKQPIKASGTKEISDRSSRSVSRTELKLPRRGSHGSGLHKSALSQARTSHAVGSSLKQSRSRESYHARLPPMGSKPVNYVPEMEMKPVSLQPSNPIRRSHSEGTL